MSRYAYVDGRYVAHRDAAVHIEDRGYQFADAVYEVCAVSAGHIVDFEPHCKRLRRSLDELRIDFTMSSAALLAILGQTTRRNRIDEGMVYVQISRGTARRGHAFPSHAHPVLVVTARHMSFDRIAERARAGVGVVTRPDMRWRRCDIKSVSLLANILAKQEAHEQGAHEAWLVDAAGLVTEGSSSNAWIVERGEIVTRNPDNSILSGITRSVVRTLAGVDGRRVVERAFTVEQAMAADEAFQTSTTSLVMPVTTIDSVPVGSGRPGPVSLRLLELYRERLAKSGQPR